MPKERTFRVCFKIKGEWLERPCPYNNWNGVKLGERVLKSAIREHARSALASGFDLSNITVEEVK